MDRQVVIVAAVEVPDLAAPRLAVVGGPLAGREHLGAFAQQLGAPRNVLFRVRIAFLGRVCRGRRQPKQPGGIVVKHVLQVVLVQAERLRRVEERAQRFQTDQREAGSKRRRRVDMFGAHPEKAVTRGHTAPPLKTHGEIAAPQEFPRPERAEYRQQRRGFADSRGVEPHVFQPPKAFDGPHRIRRVETAGRVGEHELRVGVLAAVPLNLRQIVRVGQRARPDEVQHDHAPAFVGEFPDPAGHIFADGRVAGVFPAGITVVGLESGDPRMVEKRGRLFTRHVRCGDDQPPRTGMRLDLLDQKRVRGRVVAMPCHIGEEQAVRQLGTGQQGAHAFPPHRDGGFAGLCVSAARHLMSQTRYRGRARRTDFRRQSPNSGQRLSYR